jgi:general secretion pathway protein A
MALASALGHNAKQQAEKYLPLSMYYQYFGLDEAPFSIAVNPRYLFMSARHRDALAHLLYGVGAGGGFILLTGEVGTGKTTINRCLLEQLPHDTDIAIILNPALNAIELLATACDELGIEYDPDNHTLKTLTDKLHRFLLDNYDKGRKTVLMIDEAQHLDFDVLEQIRLLTNLETHDEKLLQIILIGQPELAQMLARPELRQLNQRITARYNLDPLNLEETGAYIRHRLQVAGMSADREVFPSTVVKGIFRQTRGIPRLINVLCDRILLGAYGRNKTRADRSMLRQAAHEVMGEELVEEPRWRWPLALAGVLLLALAGGWWYAQQGGNAAVPVAKMPVPGPAEVARAELPSEQEEPDSSPGPSEPAPVLSGVAPDPTPTDDSEPDPDPLSRWLLPPVEAEAMHWSLYSADSRPEDACPERAVSGVACVEDRVAAWEELGAFNRPLLLDMVTAERFSAAVLLLGFEGRHAWVATDAGVERAELAALGPLWSGRFRFLWHPPPGFERPLAQGDSGPVVALVAGLFARLDGQARTLADQTFNVALRQRVELFQRQQGLEDDGVVGVKTLLKLNELLGIDVTAQGARQVLGEAAAVVQR